MTLARIRDIRRYELLQAAYEVLKREGLQATTIDKIGLEAGPKGSSITIFRTSVR